jgi:hypothetical protein
MKHESGGGYGTAAMDLARVETRESREDFI